MEPNETMVEEFGDMTADDALDEIVAEDTGEPDESLESFLGEEAPAEESKEPQPQGTSEPGWIKKRVDKAVQKAIAETEARMQASFDKQMAPLREQMLNTEAQALVSKGIVKDLETAKELVRYRQGGMPPVADNGTEGQPRNERGQFTSAPKEDPATAARIEMLKHQADRIRGNKGPDVIAEFNGNDEIKQKVISGEMDFYDVAEFMRTRSTRKRPPAPTRSPNGVSETPSGAIMSMSDDQFDKLVERVRGGTRFRER